MKFWIKLSIVFSSILFILFLSPQQISASNEFSVDTNVIYNIQDNGKTIVTHNVTLENNLSNIYATTYTLGLENINISEARAESDKGEAFQTEIFNDQNKTEIKVIFPDSSVGKGTQRHFKITYINTTFAIRTGEVWEVSVPRLGDNSNFRNYTVTMIIPKSFGLEAYISPKPLSMEQTENGYVYIFDKENITRTGISAGFGQFQVFSFTLSYHLENPLPRNASTEIAIPPDTAFQKVYIQKMDPQPSNVIVDADGNWIAIYDLEPRQRIDVTINGVVQIFASYRSFDKPTPESLQNNLKETEFWQVGSDEIQKLSKELKTPEAIYRYVSSTLKYDSTRVKDNVQRMGALEALKNPYQAICMEFTDLFIAIARASGIPAREINGYAYTENPNLEPLGLVADVLHSWPEYYDKDKGVWIPIDPTWGSTSGVDYFNKLDLRHFTFVIHGSSSTHPYPPGSYKLGSNPQKDVYVSFGQLPNNKVSIPEVKIEPVRNLPLFSSLYETTITNPGPSALYSISPIIYYDSLENNRTNINVLPPFSRHQIEITIPYSILGKDTPNILRVSVNSSSTELITNKKQVILYSLIAVLIFISLLTIFMLIKLKKISIKRFFDKISSNNKNNERNIIENTKNDNNT